MALNFCSETITYCFEIIVTNSLNLKMLFATRPWASTDLKNYRNFNLKKQLEWQLTMTLLAD